MGLAFRSQVLFKTDAVAKGEEMIERALEKLKDAKGDPFHVGHQDRHACRLDVYGWK